ncbi:MAG: hypothetical protein ACRD3L_11700 [Terriglobales bacterium]
MLSRTPALGTVRYKGQRAQIMAVLLNPKFPTPFTREQVVDSLDKEAYSKTFKSETSISNSVCWHLRELTKLGQLQRVFPQSTDSTGAASAKGKTLPPLVVQAGRPLPDGGDCILDMARDWYGYGRWDAPYWFIGPEPGMAAGDGNLGSRCEAWIKLGAGELVDCKDHHFGFGEYDWHREIPPPKPQSTWKQLIRLLLAVRNGRTPTIEDVLAYQQRSWGMKTGESCVIELCSLAANNLEAKKHVGFDANCFLTQRVEKIRSRMRASEPAFVVMYGTRDRHYWEAIAGVKFSAPPEVHIVGDGPTLAVFADHPVSKMGVSGKYWLELAATLRQRMVASRA